MKYLDILQPAIDQWGFIAQLPAQDRDGGDTAQREGMLMLWAHCALRVGKISQADYDQIQTRYLANYDKLRAGCMPGEITRHRGDTKWYDLKWRMSRDQWTPNVIASTFTKKHRLDWILGSFLRGALFTTNLIPNYVAKGDPGYKIKLPDITLLASWGYMLRYAGWAAWPLVCVTDLELLVNSILWYFRLKNSANTNTDILNHVNSLLQAKYACPTPVSWLARKMLNVDDVLGLLDRYFDPESPAMNLIARDFLPDAWK